MELLEHNIVHRSNGDTTLIKLSTLELVFSAVCLYNEYRDFSFFFTYTFAIFTDYHHVRRRIINPRQQWQKSRLYWSLMAWNSFLCPYSASDTTRITSVDTFPRLTSLVYIHRFINYARMYIDLTWYSKKIFTCTEGGKYRLWGRAYANAKHSL